MENAVLRLYLERFKTLNQQELGRLIILMKKAITITKLVSVKDN